MKKVRKPPVKGFSGQQLARVEKGEYCKGLTFEHWSDRDMVHDEHICRVWQQVGFAKMPAVQRMQELALEKPWCWDVTIMCKMPDGEIKKVEIALKTPIRLQEVDHALNEYRAELFRDSKGFIADGWRAVIK